MKTISTIVLAILCLNFKAFAQPCSVANTSITVTNVNPQTKEVTFDLTFSANFNNGSKHAVVHLWEDPAGGYPATINYPASAAATGAAKGTLVIRDPGSDNPTFVNAYPSSLGSLSSPYMQTAQMAWSGSSSQRTFTFKGVKATLSTSSSLAYLKGDVYATQNDNNTTGGCVSRGSIYLAANNPLMSGYMQCGTQRSVNLSLSTLQATSVTFRAYRDVAPFGIFDESDRLATNELVMTDAGGTSATKTVSTIAQPVNEFSQYGPYVFSGQTSGSKFNVWMVANLPGNTYNNILLINNPCTPLPVSYQSFTAVRSGEQVQLKWTTSREEDNAGFAVERKIEGGNWRQIGSVNSLASGGNSSETQQYSFTDLTAGKGLIQYRLRQSDLSGGVSYSEIRTLRGEGDGSLEVTIFPNPVKGGRFTVQLPDDATCDLQLSDGTGRVIKTLTGVRGARTLEAVQPGIYFVKLIDKTTGASTTKKLMVQ